MESKDPLPEALRSDVQVLWAYHDMLHIPRRCDVGIGLGSHDLGVAIAAAELFHQEMFPYLVFSGANAPTTIERFPAGEAVAYRDYAIEHGVPADAIMIDTRARNTQQNITFSRALLEERGIKVGSVLLMSRPYQQRRAYATCRKVWPVAEERRRSGRGTPSHQCSRLRALRIGQRFGELANANLGRLVGRVRGRRTDWLHRT